MQYELALKTTTSEGAVIPKGRPPWPRETKPQSEEGLLVFGRSERSQTCGSPRRWGLELVVNVNYPLEMPLFVSGFS